MALDDVLKIMQDIGACGITLASRADGTWWIGAHLEGVQFWHAAKTPYEAALGVACAMRDHIPEQRTRDLKDLLETLPDCVSAISDDRGVTVSRARASAGGTHEEGLSNLSCQRA